MAEPKIDDLRRALSDIRDAAKQLRVRDWAAATDLRYVIEDRLDVVAHPCELHVLFQSLRGEVHRACLSWLATYRDVESHQHRAALRKAGLVAAEKLVRSIDTLLAAMQSPTVE